MVGPADPPGMGLQASDRGAEVTKLGSFAARMAFGRLRGRWVQELKSLKCGFLHGSRPAAEVLAVFSG